MAVALFYGGGAQFVAQATGAVAILLFAFAAGYVTFQMIAALVGNRVTHVAELDGLDVAELGTAAYPDFGAAGPHDSGG
jgi:Amt family ammonium transporter